MAEEYRSLFGLPESVMSVDPAELAAEEARRQDKYLQLAILPECRLMVDTRCGRAGLRLCMWQVLEQARVDRPHPVVGQLVWKT